MDRGRRGSSPRQFRFPGQIVFHRPGQRQVRVRRNAGSCGSAKARPVFGLSDGRGKNEQCGQEKTKADHSGSPRILKFVFVNGPRCCPGLCAGLRSVASSGSISAIFNVIRRPFARWMEQVRIGRHRYHRPLRRYATVSAVINVDHWPRRMIVNLRKPRTL